MLKLYMFPVCSDVKHKLTWRFKHAMSALPRGTLARTSSRGVRFRHHLGDNSGGYTSPSWHQMSCLYQLLTKQNRNCVIPMSNSSDSKFQFWTLRFWLSIVSGRVIKVARMPKVRVLWAQTNQLGSGGPPPMWQGGGSPAPILN